MVFMSRPGRILTLLALCLVAAGPGSFADGQPAGAPEATPAHFRAFLMVLDENATSDGQKAQPGSHGMPAPIEEGRGSKYSAMVSITIDRWCSADERAHVEESGASGGTKAVLAALRETEVGSIQVGDGPRRSIRWASYWKTGEVTRVSLAVLERLVPQNYDRGALPPTAQPIVILEFSVPPVDDGEGTLVTVTEAGFDRHGNIEAESVPPDGVERLTGVTRVESGKHDKK
jgi:hypothetical protein